MHPVKYLIYSVFAVYLTVVSYFAYDVYNKINTLAVQAQEMVEIVRNAPKVIPKGVVPYKPKPKPQNIPKLGPFPDGGKWLFGK